MSRDRLLVAALALTVSGCLSSSSGYSMTRDTVRERTQMEVADGEGTAALRSDLLRKPLTADSAARLALLNSPAVDSALASIGMARAQALSLLRLPNPSAELDVHYHPGEGSLDLGVGVSIGLIELLLAPARGVSGGELLDAASLDAAGLLLDVAFEAKLAFIEYQSADQILQLGRTATYASAQSAEMAAKLVEAGNVPELDALREQALYEESRLALARAEVHAIAARERVNARLGLFGPEAAAWKAGAPLAEPDAFDFANLEARAVAANLDLTAEEKRYAAAATQSDVAWVNGVLPDLEAGIAFEREDDEADWGFGPRIQVGLPLFYQGQAEIAAADAQMRQSKSRRAGTAIRIRAAARTLAADLAQARDGAALYRKTLLPLRERIVEETLRQYNAMNQSPFQVLRAKREQIETTRGHVEVLRDYWLARTRAEGLLAGRLPAMTVSDGAPGAAAAPAADSGH